MSFAKDFLKDDFPMDLIADSEPEPERLEIKPEGDYSWMHNFYFISQKSALDFLSEDGSIQQRFVEGKSLEHIFQASKTLDKAAQDLILEASSVQKATKLADKVKLDSWESRKVSIMKRLVFDKFDQNMDLTFKLLLTKDAKLFGPNDKFWGITAKGGENMLGKILEDTRWAIQNHRGSAQDLLHAFLREHKLGFLSEVVVLNGC